MQHFSDSDKPRMLFFLLMAEMSPVWEKDVHSVYHICVYLLRRYTRHALLVFEGKKSRQESDCNRGIYMYFVSNGRETTTLHRLTLLK